MPEAVKDIQRATRAHYDRWSYDFETAEHSAMQLDESLLGKALAAVPANGSVLDGGCGTGLVSRLARAATKARVVMGLDLSRQSLGRAQAVNDAVSFSYREAGHLLGAASAEVEVQEAGQRTRIVFSGDVGRFGAVLTKDPELAPDADYLVIESTYGNRTHPEITVLAQLEGVLKRTFARVRRAQSRDANDSRGRRDKACG